jgi:hypothetical protein
MTTVTVEDQGSRWVRVGKPVGQGHVTFGIQKAAARGVASAILEGIERWAADGLTRTVTIPALLHEETLHITFTLRGGVRLASTLPDGAERFLHVTQAEAADIALQLVELA